MIKSFFLIFLLMYLSFFPSTSLVPIVEIVEEEIVVHTAESLIPFVLITETEVPAEYPPPRRLAPQYRPRPQLRPPAHS